MPKRVLVYEELTAFGHWLDASLTPLFPEGLALSKALVEDLSHLDGIQTTVIVHPEFEKEFSYFPGVQIVITDKKQIDNPFHDQKYQDTFALIVAPETGSLLETRVKQAANAGLISLNCGNAPLKNASDKWLTFLHWKNQKVSTPLTKLLYKTNPKDLIFPVIFKPRDGAGACDTFLVKSQEEFYQIKGSLNNEEFLIQPHCKGKPVSVSFISNSYENIPIMAGEQHVKILNKIEYVGGTIPLDKPLLARAVNLANKALEGLMGLNGWVGVDLILGCSPDGTEDYAIEINPRLTTSYIGIRNLIPGKNLMKMLLGIEKKISLEIPQKTISFKKNGEIIEVAW